MSIFTVIGVKSFAQLGRLCLASNSRPSAWCQIASTQDLVTSFRMEEGTPLEVDNSYTRIKNSVNTGGSLALRFAFPDMMIPAATSYTILSEMSRYW